MRIEKREVIVVVVLLCVALSILVYAFISEGGILGFAAYDRAKGGNVTELDLHMDIFPYWVGYYGNLTEYNMTDPDNITVERNFTAIPQNLGLFVCGKGDLYATLSTRHRNSTEFPTIPHWDYLNSFVPATTAEFDTYFDFDTLSPVHNIVKGAAVFNETKVFEVADNNQTVLGFTINSVNGTYEAGLLKDLWGDIILVFRLGKGYTFHNQSADFQIMLPFSPIQNITYFFFQDALDDCDWPPLPRPNLSITLHPDGVSAILNWTNISLARTYNLYYVDNMPDIVEMTLEDMPLNYTMITGITELNYTDEPLDSIKQRYYKVSAYRFPLENLTWDRVGKYTYNLSASSNGIFGSNLISIPLITNQTFESFLQKFPATMGPRPAPHILKLDRNDPESQPWGLHIRGWNDHYKDYPLEKNEGYILIINETYHRATVVGYVSPRTTIKYKSSLDGILGSNLVGFPWPHHTFDSFLQEIPPEIGPRPAPHILKLDRSDPEQQPWILHIRDWHDFGYAINMTIGEGYVVIVNQSYNHAVDYK
ncbi:hypothetical protein HQ545_07475 [Candidatus Woesearchaeota archaeon]|nr:hypothetical protein [Candidatus Woesearchaeota archaeon]